jgi:hypothetical protein
MEQLKKSEAACLQALDDMCEMLAKASGASNLLTGIKARRWAPEVSPEQIYQARGQVEPIRDQPRDNNPTEATLNEPEMPTIDPNVARDLSQYTPEHLHSIVQHASKKIASAIMEGMVAHQQTNPGKRF